MTGVGAVGLFGASAASAAVEFGNGCVGDGAVSGEYTLTTLVAPGPLPLSAPSNGVITKLRSTIDPIAPISVPTLVKTLRSAGGDSYTVTGQSTMYLGTGVNVADARLPVLAGDRLGLGGVPFFYEGNPVEGVSYYCKEEGPNVLGAVPSEVPVGASAAFKAATNGAVPLVAVLEPDADADGYGDETQDKCPQGNATQAACPLITIDSLNLTGNGSVSVLVATSSAAPVQVSGLVKLGKGKQATLKAATKTVNPGRFTRFKLKFDSALKERLKELKPSKKLALKITASATNIAGQVSTDKSKVNLKGQGQ